MSAGENSLGWKIPSSLHGVARQREDIRGPRAGEGPPQGRGAPVELGVGTGALALHGVGYDRALTEEVSRISVIRQCCHLPAR